MNILITGAAGFVGRNLVENLKNIRDGKNCTRPFIKIDNVYEYDGDDMIADMSGAWLGLNGQFMPYYHLDTEEEDDGGYTITGYAPILLNGVRSKLLIVFDDENPDGYVAGAVTDYDDESVQVPTTAKSSIGLNVGDKIQFVCDYYTYDMKHDDSYKFGEEITVTPDLKVSDLTLDDVDIAFTYRFTDIYDHEYWTPLVYVD